MFDMFQYNAGVIHVLLWKFLTVSYLGLYRRVLNGFSQLNIESSPHDLLAGFLMGGFDRVHDRSLDGYVALDLNNPLLTFLPLDFSFS